MAFDLQHFQFNRGVVTANAQGQGFTPVIHSYKSATDTRATIAGAGYFPPNIDGTTDKVFVGDALFIVGSDGTSLVMFTGLTPVVLGADLLVSGPSLTVGAPIAPVDTNAIRISANVVTMEVADPTHPGIIDTTNQTFAGIKAFDDGINVFGQGVLADNINATGASPLVIGDSFTTLVHIVPPTTIDGLITAGAGISLGSGASPILSSFHTQAIVESWTGPWAAPIAGQVNITVLNNVVFLTVKGVPSAVAANVTIVTGSAAIPTAYFPLATIKKPILVFNNGNTLEGLLTVSTSGVITIGGTITNTDFISNAGFGDETISWAI